MLSAASKMFSLFSRTSARLAVLFLSMLGASTPLWATPVASQTSLTVSPSGTQPTKTVLTLTATVVTTSGSVPVTQGTVYFYDTPGTYVSGGVGQPQPHLVGRAQMVSSGTATLKTILPSTTHSLQAVYMPTPQALGSASSPVSVTVTGGGNEVVRVIAATGGVKNAYSILSQLRYQGLIAPTGTLTITDNTTSSVLGTTTHITDQGASSFGSGSALGTTANASGAVSLVDMDGDGILDLVAASGSTVSISHGVGDGTFNGRQDFTIPSGSSTSIDTGDVNNDGYPDVVISDTGNNTVNVLLNNGSGGLLSGTMYTVTSPGKLILGDFGSGYLDIATLQPNPNSQSPNPNPNGVGILTNSGVGTYGAASLLNVAGAVLGTSAQDFTVGDFNADGHLDVVVLDSGVVAQLSAYTVFFSNGSGGFNGGLSTSNQAHYVGIAAADVNDDGITDVASSLPAYNVNASFVSNGNGSFSNLNDISGSYTALLGAGDFNGDGRTDLLLAGSSGFYTAYDNRGLSSSLDYQLFGPTSSPTLSSAVNGYILGDGLSDFLFAGGGSPALWLSYLNVNAAYPAPSTAQQTIGLLSTTSLAPHSVTVTYTPNSGGSYGTATSNTVQLTPMGNVTPSLTVSPSTINYNSGTLTTTLTATMATLSSTPPTGSITFYDNGNQLGTATLNSGSAAYSYARPDGGTHSITAVYSGDSNYITNTSTTQTLTVVRENPSLTLSPSVNTRIVAGMVTLTGTISAVNTNVAGVVLQFDIAGYNAASCTITTSGASGSCAVQVAVPNVGSLVAHVSNPLNAGAMPNLASGSATASITGTQAAANFILSSSVNPSYQSQVVTITATAPSVNGVYPNGSLQVFDNGTLIQTLSFASATSVSFTNNSWGTGSHALTTQYGGDSTGRTLPSGNVTTVASFTATTGAQTLTQTVVAFTVSLPVTVTPQNTSAGTLQTISVTVNSGGVAITGVLVQFYDALRNPSYLGTETVNSSGVATFTSLFAPGQHLFYVVATLPGTGQTTHTSSQVASTVTPSSTPRFPLALNLGVTGTPGNYTSTVTANYHSNYPLGPLSFLNASNGNSQLTTANFGPPVFTVPATGTSLTAGIGAYFSAAGDVNSDGKMDLVVANYYDGTVSVYLGNGDGTFQAPNVITTSNYNANSIILDDFDGDGNLDFLIICDWQQGGNLYYGDGAGNFTLNGYLNIPNATTDQIAIDLDKDGLLDTVTVGFGIWKNIQNAGGQGSGFTDSYVVTPGGSPVWVAGGDFNNDGYNDIVTANIGGGNTSGNSISVLLNDGTGNITGVNYDIPGTPGGITTGDFDEDGNLDIAISLYDLQGILLIRGDGNGNFYPYTFISAGGTVGAGNIKLVDYDGDGSLDLLVTDTATVLAAYGGGHPTGSNYNGNSTVTTSSGNLLYLRGDGMGNFDPAIAIPMGTGTTPYSFVVSDFDGDGIADLAIPQTASFDNSSNITTASTVGIFLGSNTATALLTNSSAVNSAGPIQMKAQHPHGSPDVFALTNSNTVQLQSLTTAAVTASANPSPLNSALTLYTTVATVAGVVPTGTVQFFDGATSLGTGSLIAGVAHVTTASLTLGGHTITAFYNGDANFQAVSATALALTITPAATTVALTSSANPANYGASVTFTATLGNNAATGTVNFFSGSTQIGSAQIASGVATFTTSSLPLGSSSIAGRYLGDTNNSAAFGSLSQQINQATTTITLALSPTSTTYGTAVTMTATLGSTAPTGTVTFTNGSSAVIGTAQVQNGVATISTSSLPVGTTSYTATYSGDTYYASHTSSASSLTITQATLTLTAPYASPNSSIYGHSVVLTQIMPSGATGTVQFSVNGSNFGSAVTIASGVASLTTTSLPLGNLTLATTYGGNTNYTSATSPNGSATVTTAVSTTTGLTSSLNPSTFGASVTFTATVSNNAATGAVQFYDGSSALGASATVHSGVATYATTSLSTGPHAISAVYSGDSNYATSTSLTVSQSVTALTPSLSAPTASPAGGPYGTSITLTQTVPSGATGTVGFYSGSTLLCSATISGTSASCATTTTPAGTNSVTGSYTAASGSGYSSATSAALSVTITQVTPTLSAPTASPSGGAYGTSITLTQTVPSGATGTVDFYSGSTLLCSATISGTTASCATTTIPAGTNSVTGSFTAASGSGYASATSAPLSVTVTQATPTLSAPSASPAGGAYGTSITLTQTVPAGATGTVGFYASSTLLCTATISGTTASCATTTIPAGTSNVTGNYTAANGSGYASANSASLSVTMTQATPTLGAPTASPAGGAYGTSITLTQTVPTGAVGTVGFYSGSTLLCTATISGTTATCATTTMPTGTNSVTGNYTSGFGSNYSSATSAALSVTVTAATPTLAAPTASPAGGTYGTSITLTQTVPTGATGTVGFYSGSTLLCTATISGTTASCATTTMPSGTNSVTGSYTAANGSGYASATSAAQTVTITQATPSLSAPTASPAGGAYGTSITLTQTVPTGATGTVGFYAGSTLLCTATISGTTASCATTTIPAGTSNVTGNYTAANGSGYASANSASLSVTITQATPTLAAPTASPAGGAYGTSITLTQTVPAGAIGSVGFYSGSTLLCTATISGTTASCATTTIPVGTNSVTGSYTPSFGSNYSSATSAALSVTVTAPTPTLTAPVASPAGGPYGTSITLAQTVPTGATGIVGFYSGSTLLCTATISGTTASCASTTIPAGTNAVTGSYIAANNSNYGSATSPGTSVVITQVTTSLGSLTISPSTSVYGTSVTITQAVPTGLTGTVNFYSTPNFIGSGTISAGVATFTTTTLPVGTDAIRTIYTGDTNHTSSQAGPVNATVTAATSATALTTSTTTSVYGTSVVLTSTVTVSGSPLTSGTVTFLSGSTSVGTVTLNSSGVATLNTTTIPAGVNVITANLAATGNYSGSTSTSVTLTVSTATPTLTAPTASPAGGVYGTSITLTQTVPPGVTGTIVFLNGSTFLGSATISSGVAVFTTSSLPVGTNSITGSFPGNNNFGPALSSARTVTISLATPTLTAPTASPVGGPYGTSITLTQTVPTGATGTVGFYSGSTLLCTATITGTTASCATTTTPVGNNTVTGTYTAATGSAYVSATSAALPVTITATTPTLTAPTASPVGGPYGTSITLTQTVPTGATGTVSFNSGSTILCTATITGTTASCATTTTPVGTNAVTGSYIAASGSIYTSATSATLPVTITAITPTLTAPTASPAGGAYGTSITLTQAVPTGATGTVNFYSGSTLLCTATITGTTASCATTTTPVGTNAVTGSYTAATGSTYTSATSAALPVTITAITPTLTAPTASPVGGPYGTSITLTQTVPTGATGTVGFYSGSTLLCTATITGTTASCATTTTPVGTNAVTGSYTAASGSIYTSATSATLPVIITAITPTLTAPTASPVGGPYGTSITLTQAVPAGATGTVNFYSGSTLLCTATITGTTASCATTTMPVGTNAVTGSYTAATGSTYTSATSTAMPVTITAITPTLTAPTVSPAGGPYGTSITLTQAVPAGATGTVNFYSGSTLLCTATITGTTASCATTTMPVGTNAVTGTYTAASGSIYSNATSATLPVTITALTPTLTAPTASPIGGPVGTSITLTQAVPAGVTGTITFYNGTTVLGTATIANGVATLTTTALPVGTNSITASYGGNTTYATATSPAVSITITLATTTLSAPSFSPSNPVSGTAVTLTQTVPAGVTGTITFYNGTTALGTATIANGVATLTTTALPVGTNSITASYGGNTTYATATSPAVTVTVTSGITPGYTITANPTSLTIHAGSTGTSMLSFLPVGGYSGTFTLACNNLPANASCQFMQNGAPSNTVVMTGNNQPIMVGLNVITSTSTTHSAVTGLPLGGKSLLILNGSLFALIALGRRKKLMRGAVTLCGSLMLGALLLGGLTGCAGGFGVATTPPGTSVATVTATATASTTGGSGTTAPGASLNLTITIIP